MVRGAATAFLITVLAVPLCAEVTTAGETSFLLALIRGEGGFTVQSLGNVRLSFSAEGSRDVKGTVDLSATLFPGAAPGVLFDVPRAFLKARFPAFRLTVGKTRLSWGEGFVFNAGDVLFGDLSPSIDLAATDPRDRTAWLAAVYVPLGDFSFAEAVLLPFPPGGIAPAAPIEPWDKLSAGGRLLLTVAGLKGEAGVLYRGDNGQFLPYASLQGHLLVDIAACAGFSLSATAAPGWDDLWKGSRFSISLSRAFGIEDLGTLGIRAEAAIVANGYWTQSADALLPGAAGYGLYVYPEIAWSPSDAFGVQIRGMLSPVDASGAGLASVSWSPLQGFSLAAGASAQFGESGDLFGWDRAGDLSFFAKATHKF